MPSTSRVSSRTTGCYSTCLRMSFPSQRAYHQMPNCRMEAVMVRIVSNGSGTVGRAHRVARLIAMCSHSMRWIQYWRSKRVAAKMKSSKRSPDLNCGDFTTHRAAQACYDYCVSLGYGNIYRLDGHDKDGLACESLP